MKINVEFDLTPDEFRRSLGLPDVEAFQKDLLDRIHKQMESGVEGYDPMSLMQPFLQQPGLGQGLSQGLANFGTYQQMMLDMLSNAASSSRSSSNADTEEKDDKASSGKSSVTGRASEKSTRSSKASSASSRARSSGEKSSRDTGKS